MPNMTIFKPYSQFSTFKNQHHLLPSVICVSRRSLSCSGKFLLHAVS